MEPHSAIDLPVAPGWSIALGSLGRGLIWFGLGAFLLTLLLHISGRQGRLSTATFIGGCVALLGAITTLGILFVQDRFEFLYVYQRSDSANPLKYKIASIWSGQQGSFLLWACSAAVFGLFTMRGSGSYRRWYVAAYALFLGALCGILAYETPFTLQPLLEGKQFVPPNGVGMTPSLQNYWVVIHPPTIFLGFGALTVLFAYAFSALVSKDYSGWVKQARPWAILSMTLTGLGLCMGGFWAYETLGWGGFWMWDPVENVSFVPWVFSVILVHGIIVQTTKQKWVGTNILFGGLPFLSFLYGTFLTRAGFLDGASVHSFAQMDRNAHKVLLGLFFVATLGFLGLWLARLKTYPKPTPETGVRREGFYQAGSILLFAMAAAAGIGMSVPLFQAMAGQKPKVVSEHTYHLAVSWFFIPLIVAMAIAPFVSWRRMNLRDLWKQIVTPICIAMGVMGVILILIKSPTWGISPDYKAQIDGPGFKLNTFNWISTLFGVCLFATIANLAALFRVWRGSKLGWGAFITHIGVATAMAGLIFSRGFEKKAQIFVQAGTPASGLGYLVTYKTHTGDFMNRNNKMLFDVEGMGDKFEARPGLFYTLGQNQEVNPMVWPHIHRTLSHDVYFTLHPQVLEASENITIKPGETKEISVDEFAKGERVKYKVAFDKPTQEGEPGKAGAKFGAMLRFITPDRETKANPTIELTESGMRRNPDLVNDDYYVNVVSMNAADKSVTLQLGFIRPVYPIEIFYKPLTILVWVGTAIMTLGGIMAALYRRFRKPGTSQVQLESIQRELSAEPALPEENAPVPTP